LPVLHDPESSRFFRGSELPRLVLLLTIAVGGWACLWFYSSREDDRLDEPGQVVTGAPSPVEPDRSPPFETVVDKMPLGFRDSAAYETLLTRSRETTAGGLAEQARRDILYAQLWERPSAYRGVPVHLIGAARRVLYYPSKLSRSGWLYEAWIFTPESRTNPYVCVFEEAPKGFPVGADVSERVVFNGYFLKLMRYQAGDVARAAPLLVGRIGWMPRPPGKTSSDSTLYWLIGGLAVMLLGSLVRWSFQLRRSLASRSLRSTLPHERPNEVIAPEALASWLESVPDDEPS
jgi:hypothetical protein